MTKVRVKVSLAASRSSQHPHQRDEQHRRPKPRAHHQINLIGPGPLLHAAIVVGRPALELGDHHGDAIVSRRIGQSPRGRGGPPGAFRVSA